MEGANPTPQIAGIDSLPGKVNYILGNNPEGWRTGIPTFAKVRYEGIYPGVDLVFYGNQRRLEYDFVVAPGTDPKVIELSLKGAQKLAVDTKGNLVLSVSGGKMELQKPVIYQNVGNNRHEIPGRYVLAGDHRVTFAVANYDRSAPLIIDPVLNYSTYLGGSAVGDFGQAIAVDALGDAFVTGTTLSTTFPTAPGGFGAGNALGVAFVTEINPAGTALLYTTYLGGTGGDFGQGIALDNSGTGANPGGNVYVTGFTMSSDFPTTAGNALKPTSGGASVGTSFISKIDPTASGIASLVYSSYLGGTDGTSANPDVGNGIAADVNGNAYVTGLTASSPGVLESNFPITTASAFQTTLGSSDGNAFVTRIDTTKSGSASLAYSTYLGGSGANAATSIIQLGDMAQGIAVGSSENAYVVGITSSTDFPMTSPTPNGYKTTAPAAVANGTIFVARIDTSGTQTPAASLVYSTYLGGDNYDLSTAIALKPASTVAYVTGTTESTNFPTFPTVAPGPYQTTGTTGGTAFLSTIDTGQTGGASLTYSTFLGGAQTTAFGIAVDAASNAYIVGGTSSSSYPLTPGAFQLQFAAGARGEGFITKINPAGNGAADLVYSSLFGGSGNGASPDTIAGVALDSQQNAYITGVTFSPAATFPVFPAGAFQTTLSGLSDAFIAKLTLEPTLMVSPTSLDFGAQPVGATTVAKTVTLTNNTSDPIAFAGTNVSFSGTNAADFASPSNSCGGSIAAGASCTVSVTFKPSVVAAETGTMVITVTITDGGLSSSQSFNVSLKGTGTAAAPVVGLDHASVAFGGQMVTTTSTATVVTLTNSGSAPLNITSIAATPSVFTQTNTCPASPATLPTTPGSNTCTISLKFAPTAVGAQSGTLTITDNAGSSPQSIPLTGSGWDFSLTGPTTTQTVSAAAPLNFNVTMTPLGGFNQGVGLACAIAPTANTTCTVVTPVTAADGTTAQTAKVTVTKSAAMLLPPRSVPVPPVSIRQIVPLILALMLLLLLPGTKRLRLRLGMVASMAMLILLAGCGVHKTKTPPVSAALTITGTSNGTAGSVSHAAVVNLTVD
jgi:hypothetical protein